MVLNSEDWVMGQIIYYDSIFRFADSEEQINYDSFFSALNWRTNPMPEMESILYNTEVKLISIFKASCGYLPCIFNILYLKIILQYKILAPALLEGVFLHFWVFVLKANSLSMLSKHLPSKSMTFLCNWIFSTSVTSNYMENRIIGYSYK